MLIAIKNVTDQNDLMIINKSGLTIRLAISDIRITGRATQGVKLINLRSNDSIASVASVPKSEDKDEELLKSTDVAENTEISEELE